MTKAKKHQIFLSHTSADKPVVERFYETLRQFDDVVPWLDKQMLAGEDMLATIARQVASSDSVLIFWSRNALKKYRSAEGVGTMPWIAFEIRTALEAGRKQKRRIMVVLLDDTPLHDELIGSFSLTKYIDAKGLLGNPKADHGLIMWRAGLEIVGALRNRRPLYPTLKLLRRNGRLLKKNHQHYFGDTWVEGYYGGQPRPGYIECLRPGNKVPAVKCDDGGFGYRFCVPNHTADSYWVAAISFGVSDTGWHTVNLTDYEEMRFNARADTAGIPLSISFTDNHLGSVTESGHQETSNMIFQLGNRWKPGGAFILRLDALDWSINGFAGGKGQNKGNKLDVNRAEILQIVFNNVGLSLKPGSHWIEVRNVVIV